jgi:hypothetical protein
VEVGTPQQITSSFGTLNLNLAGAGLGLPDFCTFFHRNVDGVYMADIRNPNENLSVTDGALAHKFFKSAKYISMNVLIVADTPAHRQTMTDHLLGVLDPLLREDGTYSWLVPSGDYAGGFVGSYRSNTVRLWETVEVVNPEGGVAGPKTATFILIAYGVRGEDGFEDMEV